MSLSLLKEFEKNIHRWRAKKIEKGVWKIPGLAVVETKQIFEALMLEAQSD